MGSCVDVAKSLDESEFTDEDGSVIGVSTALRDEVKYLVQIDINGECVEFSPEKAKALAHAIKAHADKALRKHKASVRLAAAAPWTGGEE